MSKAKLTSVVGFLLLVGVVHYGLAQTGQDSGQEIGIQGITPQAVRLFQSGGVFSRKILTEEVTRTLVPGPIGIDGFSAWMNLPGAGWADGAWVYAGVPASLVSVRFSAESQCAHKGTPDFDWCSVRILIDGVEAHPAPADFAFDSTSNGAEGAGSWEAHAMERHRCVYFAPIRVAPIQVQWRVNAGFDGIPPEFRLDDWSLVIESAPNATAVCPAQ